MHFWTKHYAGIGSRQTPQPVQDKMRRLAFLLGYAGWTLRSGGAEGADTAFEEGALGYPTQIFLPWSGFNGKESLYTGTCAESAIIASAYHPNWDRLSQGAKKLMSRNTYQVLGPSMTEPSRFVVCWTPGGEVSGGTGQAMRIALDLGIPVWNLESPELQGLTAEEVYDYIMGRTSMGKIPEQVMEGLLW